MRSRGFDRCTSLAVPNKLTDSLPSKLVFFRRVPVLRFFFPNPKQRRFQE